MVTHSKGSRTLPQVLNDDEREALLGVPDIKTPTGLRNRCMLGLMLNGALRVSEVIGKENISIDDLDKLGGLRLDHVDLDTGKMRIINGKGKVDRNLWINQTEVDLIKKWLKIRPQTTHDLMFCTLDGGKISNRYMRAMLERTGNKAGIGRRVHPHLLRHTALTDLYKAEKDIRKVQKIAGHKDLSSTMVYTHVYDAEIEETMRNFRQK